jgi:hypothetical protein
MLDEGALQSCTVSLLGTCRGKLTKHADGDRLGQSRRDGDGHDVW